MEITITVYDDWAGIYVDGELQYENHSLHHRDVLEAIKQDYESIEVDMMKLDIGRLPDTLEELRKLIGENE